MTGATQTDPDDAGDLWREIRAARQKKRASNRSDSPQLLADAGLGFEIKNDGAHLIVAAGSKTVDFWPGTGLWIVRGTAIRRRGVDRLINFAKLEMK
jgi:hypothetical protein